MEIRQERYHIAYVFCLAQYSKARSQIWSSAKIWFTINNNVQTWNVNDLKINNNIHKDENLIETRRKYIRKKGLGLENNNNENIFYNMLNCYIENSYVMFDKVNNMFFVVLYWIVRKISR